MNPSLAMQGSYDYKQFAVLYVDDEEKSLKSFTRAFEHQFRILTATNAQDGLRLLESHPDDVGILMTDQRMPGHEGVWLLEKARRIRPRIIRILATAFSDVEAAIAAVNTGAIYKYISKPWDPPQLEATLKRALEFFLVQRERDQLLREKMSVLHHMMVADRIVSLGLLAAGLSHHIRNALVAVKTFLDLAPSKLHEENLDLNSLRNPDFWKDYHQNAQSQIQRVTQMLKDLGAASCQSSHAFTHTVHLQEAIDHARAALAPNLSEKSITLTCDIPATLPLLTVHQTSFFRFFELLLRDEIACLPPGAHIRLTAAPDTPDTHIVVRITDDGPGLSQEAIRLLFDPFLVRSDSPHHYGIDLMACYFIVHHHGGRIEARSEPGQGTTFTLHLMTNPNLQPPPQDNDEFLHKILLNDSLWEKLISSTG
ncbi:MAG: hybrid sensor histidine kinase/response regulator [Verrucomicrobia bacterium]|nr:hybrid sensor histidine kinase/response regulator [Verrucomicrobiota bacterium]